MPDKTTVTRNADGSFTVEFGDKEKAPDARTKTGHGVNLLRTTVTADQAKAIAEAVSKAEGIAADS